MQLSIDKPTGRSYSPIGRVWRLGATLLVALLMVLAQQASASASAATEPGLYDFTVSISGPATLYEYDDATYTAVPAYGYAPYTYTWFKGGTQVGTGSTYAVHLVRGSFTLQVNAKDSRGRTASATLSVGVVRECRTC